MIKSFWKFFFVIVIILTFIIFSFVAYFKDLRYKVSGPRYDKEFLPPERELGRGSFGVVFQARNKIDDCPYAIKMTMLPDKKEEQERVLREARVLAKLDHENILRYFSSWVEERDPWSNKLGSARPSRLYIQMQLCQGSLHDWLINNCEFGAQGEAKHIFSQIVSAVEYIHLMGLIHRDLKPGNILFALDGRVKVGDFGLVTAFGESYNVEKRSEAVETSQKHTIGIGTYIFMSPEQHQGLPYSNKVDIYSLGLILFLLLHPLAMKNSGYGCLWAIRNYQFPSHLNKTECGTLSLMLSKEPSQRPTASNLKALME